VAEIAGARFPQDSNLLPGIKNRILKPTEAVARVGGCRDLPEIRIGYVVVRIANTGVLVKLMPRRGTRAS